MDKTIDELKQIAKRLDDLFHHSVLDLQPEDRLKFSGCITDLRFLLKKLDNEHNDYFSSGNNYENRKYGSEL